ncbi:hypothetical protein LF941_18650 [Pectobacterium versatile]|uniref:hypothetical protein n=1 Tax=Pectobacterium versatile TaxID=2488639 RepID=UPI001CF56BCF|nr:hypothetical protein [Pectobacterium versatile]MCA6917411.1 hypothetical protein [Pectobacterium versatile]
MFESMTYQIALTPFLLLSENVDMSNVECRRQRLLCSFFSRFCCHRAFLLAAALL